MPLEENSDQPHARVTLQMLYEKQIESQNLLIELTTKMSSLEGIVARVGQLEIKQAKFEWIEKVAYASLTAGIGAIIFAIISVGGI